MTSEPDHRIRVTAEQLAEAYSSWVVNSIANMEKEKTDTGKFLLGVSSGSIGLFVTISSAMKNEVGSAELFALCIFIVSAFFAVWMTLPTVHNIVDGKGVQDIHQSVVWQSKYQTWAWFLSWIVGVLFAAGGLTNN